MTPGLPTIYQPVLKERFFEKDLAARLAREYTQECIESLAEWMRDRAVPTVSLAATQALLDRGWGKPKEAKVDDDGSRPKYKVQVEFVDVIEQKAQNVFEEQAAARPPPEPVFEG